MYIARHGKGKGKSIGKGKGRVATHLENLENLEKSWYSEVVREKSGKMEKVREKSGKLKFAWTLNELKS